MYTPCVRTTGCNANARPRAQSARAAPQQPTSRRMRAHSGQPLQCRSQLRSVLASRCSHAPSSAATWVSFLPSSAMSLLLCCSLRVAYRLRIVSYVHACKPRTRSKRLCKLLHHHRARQCMQVRDACISSSRSPQTDLLVVKLAWLVGTKGEKIGTDSIDIDIDTHPAAWRRCATRAPRRRRA